MCDSHRAERVRRRRRHATRPSVGTGLGRRSDAGQTMALDLGADMRYTHVAVVAAIIQDLPPQLSCASTGRAGGGAGTSCRRSASGGAARLSGCSALRIWLGGWWTAGCFRNLRACPSASCSPDVHFARRSTAWRVPASCPGRRSTGAEPVGGAPAAGAAAHRAGRAGLDLRAAGRGSVRDDRARWIDLLTGPLAGRIRECAAPDCALLFVDGSRPGGRRWCAGEACGNRTRTKVYRQRRKERGRAIAFWRLRRRSGGLLTRWAC